MTKPKSTNGTHDTPPMTETKAHEAGIDVWPTTLLDDPVPLAGEELAPAAPDQLDLPPADASLPVPSLVDTHDQPLVGLDERVDATEPVAATEEALPAAPMVEAEVTTEDAPATAEVFSMQNGPSGEEASRVAESPTMTTAPSAPPAEIVVSFRADAPEPQPTHQEPHALGDTWPANRTVIVGRIQRLKGRAPRMRPTEGGAYTLYTIHVAEAACDDLYADVAQMRVPLLVPDSLPRAAQKLLEKDGLVSIQGRVTQETVEDRRYSDQSGTGKQVLTLPYIKVQDVRAVAPATAQYAVIRVGGTIQRVTGVGVRLARGRADRYHIVELVATETYQRPAPAVGTRTLHTPIYVAVPEDAAHADLVLRKGNQFEVECELIELGEFLPEDHYSLQGLSDEDRQRRRRRDRIYLVATRLQPVGEATPLSNHDRKALVYRLQQGSQQRRGQQPRRQPRAEAS